MSAADTATKRITELFESYWPSGRREMLVYAILAEIEEIRAQLESANLLDGGRGIFPDCDNMIAAMHACLDGRGTIDACFDIGIDLAAKADSLIPRTDREWAIKCYQTACANLAEGATAIDANYFTLDNLAGFFHSWIGMPINQAQSTLLASLQTTLVTRPWQRLAPFTRDRISLLAH